MSLTLNVISSNRVEILYEGLKGALYTKGSFAFIRRIIIVPSPAMKEWLKLRLASDPECAIAAGIEICELDRALELLNQAVQSKKGATLEGHVPKEIELSLLFESFIRQVVSEYSSFNEDKKALWFPLLQYLKALPEEKKQLAKFQRRLTTLCSRLAKVFWQYGRYGCSMLEKWESSQKSLGWQQELWKSIKKQHSEICFSYQQLSYSLDDFTEPLEHMQVHLFAMSFISAQAYRFFVKLSALLPLHHYLLSPCQLFWSDICSDREQTNLQRYWEERRASKAQLQALDHFLRTHNSLLGNFGRMGREMAQQIEENTEQIESFYQLAESIKQISCFAEEFPPDILLEETSAPPLLLESLHADMLLLRAPDESEKIVLSTTDRSIQLHRAYTKYREVEILYSTLLHILTIHSKDTNPITPSDIVVMVPDIEGYESVIRSVFGAESSLLDFQILEMQLLGKSPLVQGFLHLLSLPAGRWEADCILDLLGYPDLQRKIRFSPAEVQQIQTWTKLSGAHWGQRDSHRTELLVRDHGNRKPVDSNPAGTWEHSISRLIMALAVEPAGLNDRSHDFLPPVEEMEISQTELLAKWIIFLRTLEVDLIPISSETKLTLREWSVYLDRLKIKYFIIDSSDKEAQALDISLNKHIQNFALSSTFLETESYPFESIYFHLEKSLKNELSSYRESHLNAVRFCSLLPMRALPAKIVSLIGMEEGSFPRQDVPFSLNELTLSHESDYSPTQTEFDRYLFLEALLSARRYLIFSYVGYSFEEQREIPPSLLVQELFAYIDSGYLLGDQSPSLQCTQKHPFDAFDKAYFGGIDLYPSYDKENYQRALAYYHKEKSQPHQFIHAFSIGKSSNKELLPQIETTVTLKELSSFASNPLKAYFNKALRIYLEKTESKQIQSEEPFVLQGLEKYQLRMSAVKTPLINVFERADKKGQLPRGLFKNVSSEGLAAEVDMMHACFLKNGVDTQNIRPLFISEQYELPICNEKGIWTVPPLRLRLKDGSEVKIVGSLKEVCPQGLLFHQKRDLPSVIKQWPQYLVLCRAIEQYNLPIIPQLLSSRHAIPVAFQKEEVVSTLEEYLEYYFLGMKVPSILIPEWVPEILKADSGQFLKVMRNSLGGSFSSFYNDYALWVFRDLNAFPGDEELYGQWKQLSEDLFSPLAQHLSTTARKK
ncbi:MAG: exodeoxyribonuclease V subunit gamma [Parachlamydiaceae bacterium]|nr:exodeoxyribonuclease V subunit gamma [Parachlamydiaceae bacterium]